MKKKQNIGFTLIELLCVLVILALLAIIVGRSIVRSVNEAKTDLTETQEKSILNVNSNYNNKKQTFFLKKVLTKKKCSVIIYL